MHHLALPTSSLLVQLLELVGQQETTKTVNVPCRLVDMHCLGRPEDTSAIEADAPTSSTNASTVARGTVPGKRSAALNSIASCTVVCGRGTECTNARHAIIASLRWAISFRTALAMQICSMWCAAEDWGAGSTMSSSGCHQSAGVAMSHLRRVDVGLLDVCADATERFINLGVALQTSGMPPTQALVISGQVSGAGMPRHHPWLHAWL